MNRQAVLDNLRPEIRDEVAYAMDLAGVGWRPIETAPLGKMVLLWGGGWRHAFPGQPNGDNGAVFVDTCEPDAAGWQAHATHWMPMPDPPLADAARSASPPSSERARSREHVPSPLPRIDEETSPSRANSGGTRARATPPAKTDSGEGH